MSSKLDDIITSYHCEACELHDGALPPVKHRVKALFLELIAEIEEYDDVLYKRLKDGIESLWPHQ